MTRKAGGILDAAGRPVRGASPAEGLGQVGLAQLGGGKVDTSPPGAEHGSWLSC